MLRCAPRRRATAPAPASPPRHYRAARRRRAPPPRAATARRPTALRAPPPPTPPPCWHTPTASRAPPHRDTTATAPPRRLAAASGGRRACREGRAADFRARDAQASSCGGFLTDGTGSTGEATLRVRDDHFSKRSSVAGPARTRAPCVMVARGPLPATASGRGAWETTRRAASSGCHTRTAAANRAGGAAGALRAMHRVAHARRRRTVRVRQGIVRAPS